MPTIVGDRFELVRKVADGDRSRGVPELWEAYDSGDRYYVKLWRRTKKDRGEIKAIWNREARGLMRLQGYPGASELFVRLVDLNSTEDMFYAILEGGRRQILAGVLNERNRHAWLQNLGEATRRRPIWEGLSRVADALTLLHNEGTIHRSLSSASIFVGPDGQGDFRLSGFEWSLRISGTDKAERKIYHRNFVLAPELDRDEAEYSPNTDWFDFGTLVSEIFGALGTGDNNRDSVRNNVKRLTTLRPAEKEFILQLIEEDPEKRLNRSEVIIESIQNIVRSLTFSTQILGRDLVIGVRLNPDKEFTKLIERASGNTAPVSDQAAQLKWISADLKGDLKIIARSAPYQHYIAVGDRLQYRIRPWNNRGVNTWDIGYCDAIEPYFKNLPDDQYFGLGERRINIESFPSATRNFRTISDRSVAWDRQFPFKKSGYVLDGSLRDVHDFFRITQSLDTLITAAQICPVEIVETRHDNSDTYIECTPHAEEERIELAQHLSLPPQPDQLRDWFDWGVEEVTYEDHVEARRDVFTFIESRRIDGEVMPSKWIFDGARQTPRGPIYTFRTNGTIAVRHGHWYLARNHEGTISQIKRRTRSIEDMKLREDLLRLLNDPKQVTKVGSDGLPSPRAKIDLDKSKLDALTSIFDTQPFFALQGPPGTGKTTLIQSFCDRLFNSDSSSQILITAHSHHTVDDVRTKLHGLFGGYPATDRPILLRLGAKDPTPHDLEPVTADIVSSLGESSLYSTSPPHLQKRIDAMASGMGPRSVDGTTDYRALQLLVQDAANITLSTSNSGDLADLSDRGRRFDWSIIEEAGKAHGFDMAAALQESHRLLLIGDHYQLKPFNTQLFSTLLEDPLRIKNAILTGVKFAPGLVDPEIVDEPEDRVSLAERCFRWRSMVTLFGSLFRASLSDDSGGPRPAATLTDQHRMHPDIAEIVGRVFYPSPDGTILESPEETHTKFSGNPPYEIEKGSWLPHQRFVWCDVDWVQQAIFARGETNGLYKSDSEANFLVKILEQIKPRGNETCSIQILSPYNDQLQAIRLRINRLFDKNRLQHMFQPPFDLSRAKRMGATVDEFQGSEADVVIVSLVRNNGLPPTKSVGFLRESNRMNVLLSRARHKIIVIGSWGFFEKRCDEFTSPYEDYAYIADLMRELAQAQEQGRLARVIKADLPH